MTTLRRLALLAGALATLFAAGVAFAANLDKLAAKLPEPDRGVFQALRIFMSPEEQEIYLTTLRSSEEREQFLKETGYWSKWEPIEEPHRAAILKREVVPGMDRDMVFMSWGKPYRIRKDVEQGVYVDVYYYRWERDRKGREFVSVPDAPSAYKNESFDKLVYLGNGAVTDILREGEDRKPKLTLDAPAGKAPAPKPAPAAEVPEAAEGEGDD